MPVDDMQRKGEETLEYMQADRQAAASCWLAVLIMWIRRSTTVFPELITSYDMAVLTEDSVSHLAKP